MRDCPAAKFWAVSALWAEEKRRSAVGVTSERWTTHHVDNEDRVNTTSLDQQRLQRNILSRMSTIDQAQIILFGIDKGPVTNTLERIRHLRTNLLNPGLVVRPVERVPYWSNQGRGERRRLPRIIHQFHARILGGKSREGRTEVLSCSHRLEETASTKDAWSNFSVHTDEFFEPRYFVGVNAPMTGSQDPNSSSWTGAISDRVGEKRQTTHKE